MRVLYLVPLPHSWGGAHIVMDQLQGLLCQAASLQTTRRCLTERGRNSPVSVTIASAEAHSRYLLDSLGVNVHLKEQK